MVDEKVCLRWNLLEENASSAIVGLRQDKKFTDLALACEDGQHVELFPFKMLL